MEKFINLNKMINAGGSKHVEKRSVLPVVAPETLDSIAEIKSNEAALEAAERIPPQESLEKAKETNLDNIVEEKKNQFERAIEDKKVNQDAPKLVHTNNQAA